MSADDVVRADLELALERAGKELRAMAGESLLITGAAGFLGYYLVRAVLEWNRNAEPGARIAITAVDSFIRGRPAWLVAALESELGIRLLEHDVREPLPEDLGAFGYVVHAAGIASPTYYREHPIATMDTNVVGLRLLLDRCLEHAARGEPPSGFLFMSSSEIYGDPTPEHVPTPETYRGYVSCTGPRACYDESKRFGETLCVNFAREHGLQVTIARPFNNYGPGLKISDRRVISDLARDIIEGRDVTLLSDGSPTRTFCYVADAIVGYLKVLVRGRSGEPYNIGTEEPEISMSELAERMVSLAGALFDYPGKVVRKRSSDVEYLVDNPLRRRPAIAKARDELGYEPVVALDEGLERSLIWYSENRTGADA